MELSICRLIYDNLIYAKISWNSEIGHINPQQQQEEQHKQTVPDYALTCRRIDGGKIPYFSSLTCISKSSVSGMQRWVVEGIHNFKIDIRKSSPWMYPPDTCMAAKFRCEGTKKMNLGKIGRKVEARRQTIGPESSQTKSVSVRDGPESSAHIPTYE